MVMGMRDTRKKLIDLLDEFPVQMEWHDNEDLANYLLSNGVWIPVRCSDCEWFKNGTCKNAFGLVTFEENHFCSYGERRADGNM
jgi:hypothetical protein